MNQTIKTNKRTGQEYPVSIKCGWPDLVTKSFRGKLRGSRSKLLGNREIDCRVIVQPPKRITNKIEKIRADIAANKAKRQRLALITNHPEIKIGAIQTKGGESFVQPRKAGKFLPKIKLA